MATITARFPGQCKACGGSFPAGTQVEWSKGAGSRHVKCQTKAASSVPAKVAPAGAVEFNIVEDHRRMGKPSFDSEVGRTFRVLRGEHKGKVVTVLTQRSSYQSAADNEDMGDCMGSGWWLTLGCRLATTEEAAKFATEEAQAKASEGARCRQLAEERATKDAELAAAKARLAELTVGMVATESFDASVFAPLVPGEVLAVLVKWSEGHQRSTEVVERRATTGEVVYLASTNYSDDDRFTLYAPRHVVEAAWAKLAERYQETPEKARDFLATYDGCVGADWRRWLIDRGA